MSYDNNKKYFQTAYRTGSDIWTHKNYRSKVRHYLAKIPNNGFVLDVGAGRGLWPFTLAELGFKVIGLDYIADVVKTNNQEVKFKGLQEQMRFVEGDVFDLQFADSTFDVVTDFGLVQHLLESDFEKYKSEVNRVLKVGGYFLNVSFSKKTKEFLHFSPANSESGEFQVEGVHYHFFNDAEIVQVYGGKEVVEVVAQDHIVIPEEHNEILVITLLQKKS